MQPPLTLPAQTAQAILERIRALATGYNLVMFWEPYTKSYHFSACADGLDRHPYAVVTDDGDELAAALGVAA